MIAATNNLIFSSHFTLSYPRIKQECYRKKALTPEFRTPDHRAVPESLALSPRMAFDAPTPL
jgi:hypothetical protein